MSKRGRADGHARLFGKAVLAMRKELGLSTEEVAELSRTPLTLLGRIESGVASGDEWGLREICALASVLNVSAEKLTDRWDRYIEEAGEAWKGKWVWPKRGRKDIGRN